MAKVTLGELGLGADDLAAIGKLSESGMTPVQIADAIKRYIIYRVVMWRLIGWGVKI